MTVEEAEKETYSSTKEEQRRKTENQVEHSLRETPATDQVGHEETKTAPVKANVLWEFSDEIQTT